MSTRMEEVDVAGGDSAPLDRGDPEVDEALPVVGAIEKNGDVAGELVGLGEGEDLERLVEGAEAAGEDDEGFGEVGEPELAHEEVVELEVERGRDVTVGMLLEGKLDIEADGLGAGLVGSAVGGLHDAGSSAGGDDVAMARAGKGLGPGGDEIGQFTSIFVVGGHLYGCFGSAVLKFRGFAFGDLFGRGGLLVVRGWLDGAGVVEEFQLCAGDVEGVEACGAEEDDGVLDALAAETGQGLLVFAEDSEGAAVGGVDEVEVSVGEGGALEVFGKVGIG